MISTNEMQIEWNASGIFPRAGVIWTDWEFHAAWSKYSEIDFPENGERAQEAEQGQEGEERGGKGRKGEERGKGEELISYAYLAACYKARTDLLQVKNNQKNANESRNTHTHALTHTHTHTHTPEKESQNN